ncbi:tellurite resistance TerB C-terminal domain-containing protein [uncultured Chryseobacterium sp.]|uniref:tellurite resistance TerB C-terminal domain-containing protein n=1 Tax=uncultured Chryseobacterium sp. TaxID=259322 RepID=UPI00258D9682|nr:tellurite resistance TerB C-terminal domain-containing protein [uncultured Chryseobacterium sp.]
MTFFIILVILFFIIAISKNQKKKPKNKVTFKSTSSNPIKVQPKKKYIEKRNEIPPSQPKNQIDSVESNMKDDSIIDVSDLMSTLISNISITSEYPSSSSSSSYSSVPYWPHQYVYSYDEINYATQEQRNFYDKFRAEFLKGNVLSLNGNTNYAFILLFDLLNDFEVHKDYKKIEHQLEMLGNTFPRTKSYGVSFLLQKLEEYNMDEEAEHFREKNQQYDYDYWKLGKTYKKKLNLSTAQEEILNRIWLQTNVFNNAEFCKTEILKQFLRAVEFLQSNYVSNDSSFVNLMDELSDLIVRKYYRYRKGSQNYKYTFDSVKGEIYGHILKLSENNVREAYSNKRKLTAEFNYSSPEIFTSYYEKVISKLDVFLIDDQKNIISPDTETEKLLNESNTIRWKSKFETITQTYTDIVDFENQIIRLAEENIKNPSVENIFYEASKFMAKLDKLSSLKLYVYYIDSDLKSSKFDNKQMNKTIQKSLFKTDEQLRDFEEILNDFIKDRQLENALKRITSVYEPKRKKIIIDRNSIQEVQKQHSGTVNLLNEYLQDELEDQVKISDSIKENETEEVQIHITTDDNTESAISRFSSDLCLSELQKEVLEIFEKSSFSIPQNELEEVLKSKNQMMSSVIDSINESCYETLDDVLIEEEDDYFTIFPDYYKKLLNND